MQKRINSYSAERQGLVEGQRLIEPHIQDFLDTLVQPIYQRCLQVCIVYGLIKIPWQEVNIDTLFDVAHKVPMMPWIDPLKEIAAKEKMVQAGFDSRTNQIRSMGRDPDEVETEIIMERERETLSGLRFTTTADGNPTQDLSAPASPPEETT
jgi:capsid protein